MSVPGIHSHWSWHFHHQRGSANVFANLVLPTPVVPWNKRFLIWVFSCLESAALHGITYGLNRFFLTYHTLMHLRCNSFSRSPCSIFITGIPVHLATTSAISSHTSLYQELLQLGFQLVPYVETSRRSWASLILL
jgi:hypothetical protein